MAKDSKKKGRDDPASVKVVGARATAGGGTKSGRTTKTSGRHASGEHHAAKAHGKPARVDTSLPATRPELMALHTAARRRRAAAALGSEEFRAAIDEIARIEVRIADVDRAQEPPLG